MHFSENVVIPTRSKLSRCRRYLMRTWRCIALCNCFIGCFGICGKHCCDNEENPKNVIELIDMFSSL